jgi:hypothetical protein
MCSWIRCLLGGRTAQAAEQAAQAFRAACRPLRRLGAAAAGRRPAAPSAPRTGFAGAPADRAPGTSAPSRPAPANTASSLREQRGHLVLGLALVGRLRRRAGHAGVHRRADAVDVGPRPERRALGVQLGRREARRVHRRQLRHIGLDGLARGAEVEQDRRAVGAQVDIGRLQVEVQQLVGMHLAQAAADTCVKIVADEALRQQAACPWPGAAGADVLLQRVAGLVGHHHVHGVVGAEEVQHAHHVRMGDAGQRPALLEKALQADAEHRQVRPWK